jgi:uncharacterized protein involved in response to NO
MSEQPRAALRLDYPVAFFTQGFRPFFLGAGIWAVLSMALWIPVWTGRIELPGNLDPLSWHMHEFLFGYTTAVIAGFLLTAVPNWTGRLPVAGIPLAVLFGLWIVGRLAFLAPLQMTAIEIALIDLAFPVALCVMVTNEILRSGNWKNLPVLGLFLFLIGGNLLFHMDQAGMDILSDGTGVRLALTAVLMLIAVIGGRIIPSFTRNWLARQGSPVLPVPMNRFDQVSLVLLFAALLSWCLPEPDDTAGYALLAAGLIHLIRLCRWRGYKTLSEPLVWVLHAGYMFVPLGAIAVGLDTLVPDLLSMASAQHVWLGGAVGTMTLAVMTRATLGHTGRPLTSGPVTLLIYCAIIASSLIRFSAGLFDGASTALLSASAISWIVAFGLFALIYGPMMLKARQLPRTTVKTSVG